MPKTECGLGQVIERWSAAVYVTDDADTQMDENYPKARARSHELGFYRSYRTTCHVATCVLGTLWVESHAACAMQPWVVISTQKSRVHR
jgi:hypothetical protein